MTESEKFATTIKNILLAEPLTTLGKRHLTAINMQVRSVDFFSDLFVQPNFKLNYAMDLEDAELIDDDYRDYRATIDFHANKLNKTGFETSFKVSKKGLYVIRGYLGTGKTTYLRWLQNEYQDRTQTHRFFLCNFEEAYAATVFLDNEFYLPVSAKQPNVIRFCLQLLKIISDMLNDIIDIAELISVYFDFFIDRSNNIIDTIEIQGFFRLISDNENEYREKLYEHFSEKLLESACNESSDFVKYLIDIIVRMFWYFRQKNGKCQVLAIDNMERFVEDAPDTPFQDCELSCILEGIKKSDEDITRIVNRIKEFRDDYVAYYVLVLTTRISTQMPPSSSHYYDQEEICSIDLSSWFDCAEITEKRLNFYENKRTDLLDNPFYKAFMIALRDYT